MATTIALSTYCVNPTENDVYGGLSAGSGRILQESYFSQIARYEAGMPGRVISGFVLPTSGSRTDATITAGSAVICGYHVVGTDNISVTFTDSATTWVWLQLATSSGIVTGAQLYLDTGAWKPSAPTQPAILLGSVVVSGGTCQTSGYDLRSSNTRVFGQVNSDGAISHYGPGNWSVSKGGTGIYTITVESGVFISLPCVLAVAYSGFTDVTVSSATAFTVNTYNSSVALADRKFNFIASR